MTGWQRPSAVRSTSRSSRSTAATRRGAFPGTWTAAEAVDLANVVRPRFVVPHHYDMFTFNTVPVADVRDRVKTARRRDRARVLRCGERWEVHR